ncbi:MAG: CBS domain-containing protein [Gammaproteobacteria bacterium]|nr:CBS domain-containing protein [Gammaproteobacteria bacterium]
MTDANAEHLRAEISFLIQYAPFNKMDQAELAHLVSHSRQNHYTKNQIIRQPTDSVPSTFYIIKQGRVRGEVASADGAHMTPVWELGPGECFPIGALLSNRPSQTQHRAIEACECLEVSKEEFHYLLDHSGPFRDFCTQRLSHLLTQVLRDVQANSLATVSDDNPLNAPLRNLLSSKPISCTPDTPIRTALETIEAAHRRSIAILDTQQHPIGILTLRDVMVRVTLAEIDINSPVAEVMTPLQEFLSPENFAYEAALFMAGKGVGHVCVVDRGRFLGLLSERDLFSLQRVGLGTLSRAIQNSHDIASLKRLSAQIAQFADQMLAQGASVSQLMRLITTLNDLITQQVIRICEDTYGKPAHAYTWLAFGSEGRMEQTLKTDQDNGILFEVQAGENSDDIRVAFLPLAKQINLALAEVGFPLCPGNIMASNPECCLSMSEWQDRFARWIDAGTPEHLLKASIFFDFRPLAGAEQPVRTLRQWLHGKTTQNSRFRRQMAATALSNRPPLGLIRDFVTQSGGDHPNAIDLKLHGVTPFVDAARIIALANSIDETNTIERLTQAAACGALRQEAVDSWIEAYQYIQLLRMRKHRQQALNRVALHNYLDPNELNELERRILKEAFRQARKLQAKLALDYQL